MESHGWEGVIFDTFSLHSGGHIFLSEPIQSLKQEIRVDPEAGQNNDGPDDPAWWILTECCWCRANRG